MENENLAKEKRIRVYLADFEENRELENLLCKEVEIVGFSRDGESALKEIIELSPDVVILETMLPKIDGFGVLEELKKKGSVLPKIIFVSSLSHTGFVSKALKDGASYFMVKPVNLDNLVKRIHDVYAIKEEVKSSKQLEEKISNIFITIGIPAHIKGYQFLREAVRLAIEEPEIIGSITKKLYPTIAEKFETSSSKVERGMRHAIEVAWNRGKIENINALFGLKIYTSNEKPTNGELIALIADKMLMEM